MNFQRHHIDVARQRDRLSFSVLQNEQTSSLGELEQGLSNSHVKSRTGVHPCNLEFMMAHLVKEGQRHSTEESRNLLMV